MSLTEASRRLRRDQTLEEKLLWFRLRCNQFGFKFRRQEPISNYIPDFVCYDRRVIVELDGSQHLNNPQDAARDEFFTTQGWRVLRFWNSEVWGNLEGVLQTIFEACHSDPAKPSG